MGVIQTREGGCLTVDGKEIVATKIRQLFIQQFFNRRKIAVVALNIIICIVFIV